MANEEDLCRRGRELLLLLLRSHSFLGGGQARPSQHEEPGQLRQPGAADERQTCWEERF